VDDYDAPCRNQVVAVTMAFADSQAAVMPYGKDDSLFYLSDAGDSMFLYTNGVLDSAHLEVANTPNNPECPNDFTAYPIVGYRMADSVSGHSIGYKAIKKEALCRYTDGSNFLQIPMAAVGAHDSTFMDSVLLGNKMFYNVNKFTSNNTTPFYIHPTLGLLQIVKDNKQYTLQGFNDKPWK
jgi:hypothetical protein